MPDGDLGPDLDIKIVCPEEGVIGRDAGWRQATQTPGIRIQRCSPLIDSAPRVAFY